MRQNYVQKRGVDKLVWSSNYRRFKRFLTPYFLIICLKK